MTREEMLGLLVQAHNLNSVVVDKDGSIVFARWHFSSPTPEESEGKHFENLLAGAQKTRLKEFMALSQQGPLSKDFVDLRITMANDPNWQVRLTCLRKDNLVVGYSGTFTRLSDFGKTMETSRQLIASARDGFLVYDTDLKILSVNNASCSILGRLQKDIVGTKITDFLDADSNQKFKDFARKRSMFESFSFEVVVINPTIDKVWVSFAESQIVDSNGMRVGSYAFMHDISEYKINQGNTERVNHFLEKIMNNISSAVFTIDLAGCFLKASQKIQEISGYNPDELIYTLFENLFAENQREIIQKLISDLIEKEISVHKIRSQLLTKTGEIRHIQFTMSPLTENKVITSLLGSMEDITELVVAEEHLAKEREKVEFSNRMATVGTMAGGIAHEINNPVTIINVHAMNIKRHISMAPPNLEKAVEAALQIQNMCKRIVKIIQGLKAFARQDGGSERPESKFLTEVLDESLLLAQDSLTREKVTLQLDVPKELKILCRPVQIGQVLLNLVGNAIDAMSESDQKAEGKSEIKSDTKPELKSELKSKWIKISAFAANEKMVHIHVDDSGPGVPQEIRGKIMDPFFTTKDPSKGTGLGLCISFEIMKSHGGDLHLDPNYPPTRFVMTLPVG